MLSGPPETASRIPPRGACPSARIRSSRNRWPSGPAASLAFGGGAALFDIRLHLAGDLAAVHVGQLAIDLARIGRLVELHQRLREIIQAFRRAFAVRHLLVIVVECHRGKARLALVQVRPAEQVLRIAGAAMLGIGGDHLLQLRLSLRILLRRPQAIAIEIVVLGRVAGRGLLDLGGVGGGRGIARGGDRGGGRRLRRRTPRLGRRVARRRVAGQRRRGGGFGECGRARHRLQLGIGAALVRVEGVLQLADLIAVLLDLVGHRRHLAFQRGHAAGEVGDGAGRGHTTDLLRRIGARDLRLEILAGATREDLALHRAHFAFQLADAAFDVALCRYGDRRQDSGGSERPDDRTHGCGAPRRSLG
ncbi:hypothetical protein WR25_21584 [Diploscapter pachys]|uniref:Uncharacterized protein n=1 Tax=Diploscapter pachys TaxID=2018661 RepID=A0A2A2M3A4_9BILA|nr:hypothetical protein WR25_21584 [Diploscapter pachys]